MDTKNSHKHYIIFGGAGYLGIFLINAIVKSEPNAKITVITRNTSKSFLFRFRNVNVVENVKEVQQNSLIIINLAFSLGDLYSDTKKMNNSIINGIEKLIQNNQVLRIVHVSSIVLSIPHSKWDTIKVEKRNIYYYAKSYAEKRFKILHRKYKIPTTIIRSGNIVGPGSPWIQIIVKRLDDHLPITGELQKYPSNATYVGNLVHVIFNLANKADLNGFSLMNCCEFGKISWKKWIDQVNLNFKFDIIKWEEKSIEEINQGLISDLTHIKSKLLADIIPLIYKGKRSNNLIIKTLDAFKIRNAKTKAKIVVNKNITRQNKYYDMIQYDLMTVFLNIKGFDVENMPDDIIKTMPFDFKYASSTIENWLRFAGYYSSFNTD